MKYSEATPKPYGNLYTSYFSNIKNIPKHMKIFSVVRYPQDLPNIACFSPSIELLNQYNSKQITYSVFRDKFTQELSESEQASQTFDSIINLINSGEDVVFVCYENKSTYCHRQILGEIFEEAGVNYKGEI